MKFGYGEALRDILDDHDFSDLLGDKAEELAGPLLEHILDHIRLKRAVKVLVESTKQANGYGVQDMLAGEFAVPSTLDASVSPDTGGG